MITLRILDTMNNKDSVNFTLYEIGGGDKFYNEYRKVIETEYSIPSPVSTNRYVCSIYTVLDISDFVLLVTTDFDVLTNFLIEIPLVPKY